MKSRPHSDDTISAGPRAPEMDLDKTSSPAQTTHTTFEEVFKESFYANNQEESEGANREFDIMCEDLYHLRLSTPARGARSITFQPFERS